MVAFKSINTISELITTAPIQWWIILQIAFLKEQIPGSLSIFQCCTHILTTDYGRSSEEKITNWSKPGVSTVLGDLCSTGQASRDIITGVDSWFNLLVTVLLLMTASELALAPFLVAFCFLFEQSQRLFAISSMSSSLALSLLTDTILLSSFVISVIPILSVLVHVHDARFSCDSNALVSQCLQVMSSSWGRDLLFYLGLDNSFYLKDAMIEKQQPGLTKNQSADIESIQIILQNDYITNRLACISIGGETLDDRRTRLC